MLHPISYSTPSSFPSPTLDLVSFHHPFHGALNPSISSPCLWISSPMLVPKPLHLTGRSTFSLGLVSILLPPNPQPFNLVPRSLFSSSLSLYKPGTKNKSHRSMVGARSCSPTSSGDRCYDWCYDCTFLKNCTLIFW